MFDLDLGWPFRWGYQSEGKTAALSFGSSWTISDEMSFDENTKFYLCSDKLSISPNPCTITEFLLEYRTYGSLSAQYVQLEGKNRMIFPNFLLSNL